MSTIESSQVFFDPACFKQGIILGSILLEQDRVLSFPLANGCLFVKCRLQLIFDELLWTNLAK